MLEDILSAIFSFLIYARQQPFVPFLLHVPSGRLSGPTLNPLRCFFGTDAGTSSSRGLLGAISQSFALIRGFVVQEYNLVNVILCWVCMKIQTLAFLSKDIVLR